MKGEALRVAAITTLLVACAYAAAAVAIYAVASARLTSKADTRLQATLAQRPAGSARDNPGRTRRQGHRRRLGRKPGLPVGHGQVAGRRVVLRQTSSAPALPASVLSAMPASGGPVTADLGGSRPYRLLSERNATDVTVAGLSMAGDTHAEHLLVDGELVFGPLLMLVMFGRIAGGGHACAGPGRAGAAAAAGVHRGRVA